MRQTGARTRQAGSAESAYPTLAPPDLEIVIDSHEHYAYLFKPQQATTHRAALRAGDHGVMCDSELVASVEQAPSSWKIGIQRYSAVFKLERVRLAVVADGLAEVQVRWPNVPIVLCETRALAEEWTFRFLGAAALTFAEAAQAGSGRKSTRLPPRPSLKLPRQALSVGIRQSTPT
ncbi:MAG: hypothetical protein H0V02_06895 [Nocardioidaceae bacterium]|nr:hypothetical protein [Nocardioidaceae bacterium]